MHQVGTELIKISECVSVQLIGWTSSHSQGGGVVLQTSLQETLPRTSGQPALQMVAPPPHREGHPASLRSV